MAAQFYYSHSSKIANQRPLFGIRPEALDVHDITFLIDDFLGLCILFCLRMPIIVQWFQGMEQKGRRYVFFQISQEKVQVM